ncbi:hypothetical protein PCANC_01941 [Puccinia coronata f. sp. avenae]|uniref:Uncharacterized protein n=1 Tax=Puccinia coronata f. sp. avenae TaxID=200324 RepID=A0A2N5W4H1_9BASI|nr:hypothetical protein PCANC_12681 [Puccinia coronata f. sp. avenae]PLW51840.1 hypothetical protein PCASD_00841 [Puccinia coronata f. sp. avenae]PLW57127.1 hypothetical protein PCANC_01941 [Puccinia coronata f. sp. avenae]
MTWTCTQWCGRADLNCVFLALLDGDIPVPGAATKTDTAAESAAGGDPVRAAAGGLERVHEQCGTDAVDLHARLCRHLARGYAAIFPEGVCGGLAYYFSAYYLLGMDGHNLDQEKEFRIACVGFAATFGSVLELPFISGSCSHIKHPHSKMAI